MNWSYIAGFIDGEGSICFTGIGRSLVRIVIVNTDKIALERIHKFLDAGYIYTRKRELEPAGKNHFGHKTIYQINIYNQRDILRIAKKVMPYSIIKKDKWQKAMTLIKEHNRQ